MAEPTNIHEAQLACMEDVSYIRKERVQGLRYSVMSESEVISQCRPVLMEYGVVGPTPVEATFVCMQDVSKGDGVWQLFTGTRRFRFTHVPSKTFDEVEVFAQDCDGQGKAANKAMTVAKRYALREWLLLETGDDPYEDVEEDGDFYERACTAISEAKTDEAVTSILTYASKHEGAKITIKQVQDLSVRAEEQRKTFSI